MKLFKPTGNIKKAKYVTTADDKKIMISPERHEMKLDEKVVEYLLGDMNGSTLRRIRYLIANLYNDKAYPNVEIFSLMRNADTEHQELVLDIIGICQSKYGESCFLMINELAPKIIEKFSKFWDEEEKA